MFIVAFATTEIFAGAKPVVGFAPAVSSINPGLYKHRVPLERSSLRHD